jgi:outer membrane lipopolysaccharide assembly protein LptE/RlpB
MINNTDANLEMLIDLAAPDFKSELPNNWKSITILNNYTINQIEIPTNVKDTRLLRIMAIRKGKMIRSVEIDGDLIEKQYTIVV